MKGAVIYARYSCEKQNDQSIESQLRVCRDFAEKNGLTIIDTYADRATTGTNDNRAEFQRMLAERKSPCFGISCSSMPSTDSAEIPSRSL